MLSRQSMFIPLTSGCSALCGVLLLQIPVSLDGMLTAKPSRHPCQACTVTIVYLILSSSLAPYSIPPSDSILTGYGVCFQKRQGYRSRGSVHLMPWTGGSFLLALLLTRRRFVFRAIFSIYKQHSPSFFTISILLILWRARPSLAFRQFFLWFVSPNVTV